METAQVTTVENGAASGEATQSVGGLVLVALVTANLGNYGFQVLSGRMLGADQYGLLAGLFSAMTIITVSSTAVQTAAARSIAAGESDRSSRQRFDSLTRSTVLLGLALGSIVALISPLVGPRFNVGPAPIIVLAFYIVPSALDSIALGRFQGLHRFSSMAVYSASQSLLKIPLTLLVLGVGLGVTSLVSAIALGTGVVALFAITRTPEAGAVTSRVFDADVRRAFAAYTLFWIMVSTDVPFARALFSSGDAGVYAAAAVLGKAVLWVPAVIASIALPRLARQARDGNSSRSVMARALGLALGLGVAGTIGLFVLGETLFSVLYGEEYDGAGDIAWRIGAAMLPYVLINVAIQYHLVRRSNAFIGYLGLAVIGQGIALRLVAQNGASYAIVIGVAGMALLIAMVPPSAIRATEWPRISRSRHRT